MKTSRMKQTKLWKALNPDSVRVRRGRRMARRNRIELWRRWGAFSRNSFDRSVYRNTECGAWVGSTSVGSVQLELRVGSIIEGSDATTKTHRINMTIGGAADRFDRAVQEVEEEARQLFEQGNREGWFS